MGCRAWASRAQRYNSGEVFSQDWQRVLGAHVRGTPKPSNFKQPALIISAPAFSRVRIFISSPDLEQDRGGRSATWRSRLRSYLARGGRLAALRYGDFWPRAATSGRSETLRPATKRMPPVIDRAI